MLSVFPTLLAFGIFAPLLLRVAVGVFLFLLGSKTVGTHRVRGQEEVGRSFGSLGRFSVFIGGAVEVAIGLAFIAGFLTQVAALLGFIIALKLLFFRKKWPAIAPHERATYIFVALISLSLLVLGPGIFAVDMPL